MKNGYMLIDLLIFPTAIFVIGLVIIIATHSDPEESEKNVNEPELNSQPSIIPNSSSLVIEKCIDGITYLLVTENDENYMAPKEDRYGDNERCYE